MSLLARLLRLVIRAPGLDEPYRPRPPDPSPASPLTAARNLVLPDPLWQALGEFESAFRRDVIADAPIAQIVDGIAALPPDKLGRAAYEINRATDLSWCAYGSPRPRAQAWLAREPSLAVLFLFHRNGFVRQAALGALPATAVTPFVFAGVARRLNDWVEQVRGAAVVCAARVFADLDAAIVAEAARHLVIVTRHWRRWDEGQAEVMGKAFSRPDVIARLAETIRTARSGPMGALLRLVLRWPAMDAHLLALSQEAFLPDVRAVASQILLEGRVRWSLGKRHQWIDKKYNQWIWIPVYDERPVARPLPPEELIARAARDRSPRVRRVAADALVAQHATLVDADAIIAQLIADENRSVRERADFVRRRRASLTSSP
ncbi:MAG TPA: hypothetical protein VG387_13850 [Rhizomicrobium sp.]|nr:hypothetical protein [Rhizomicrobium sp.]